MPSNETPTKRPMPSQSIVNDKLAVWLGAFLGNRVIDSLGVVVHRIKVKTALVCHDIHLCTIKMLARGSTSKLS